MTVTADAQNEQQQKVPIHPDWRELCYRWFFQYNPLYLISAAAVLGGVYLVSEDLSLSEDTIADFCLTGVTELYQIGLIGAAALLCRVRGQRRPAVMLALIQVAYMCDLTFDIQVAGLRGTPGLITALLWLGTVPLKLKALAWALKLQVRWPLVALVTTGAAGLVGFPLLLQSELLAPAAARQLVSGFVFLLGGAGLLLDRRIGSSEQLDEWGAIVLRRATRATWAIWATAMIGHLLWWSRSYGLEIVPLLAATLTLLLLTTRRFGEAKIVGSIAAVMAAVALLDPASVSTVALMAAAICSRYAGRGLTIRVDAAAPAVVIDPSPYRASPPIPATESRLQRVACRRMVVWSVLSVYVSAWFWSWPGGALPMHPPSVASLFIIALLAIAFRSRLISAGAAALALGGHLGVQQGLIAAPRSNTHWGLTLLVGGIVSLVVAVVISWRFGGRRQATKTSSG